MRYKWQYIKAERWGCLFLFKKAEEEVLYEGIFEAKNLVAAKRLTTQATEEEGVNWRGPDPGGTGAIPKWYNLGNSSAKRENGSGAHYLKVALLNESNSS